MNYEKVEKVEYECECIREKLKEKCEEAMNILSDHFGSEDEVAEAIDLKQSIDYYKDKIADLVKIYDDMIDIEEKIPAYYPEAHDLAGDR
ncbi:MAG: hypothetical protein WC877_00565 [Dehalococcoidales bacterium]|jgi:hypothetical protein